jgi:hypothetical protein
MFRGSSGAIPWNEIRRVICTQFERGAPLALTVTCGAAEKVANMPAASGPVSSGVGPVSVRGGKRSTMADVAREANVSTSTVSRVLNDYWSIGSETQRRVEAAMRRLDYRPNEAARTMVQSRRKRNGQGVVSEPVVRSAPLEAISDEALAFSK